MAGRSRSPPTADPSPTSTSRTTIWAVDVDDGRPPEPREILAPPGWANHPAWSPDGRWIAAFGLLEPEPLDDLSPASSSGRRTGRDRPSPSHPDLDRPIGNWTDTDLNGWMVSGRHGPFWLDDATLLATVTDRGRSHPRRFPFDPATGRPGPDQPEARPRGIPGPWSEATTHTVAVARATGSIVALGTLGTRAMEVMTLDLDAIDSPAWTDPVELRLALAGRIRDARDAARRCPGPGRPDRDLDRLPARRRRPAAARRSSMSTAARSARGRRPRTSRSSC